jgi:hypothetical protein
MQTQKGSFAALLSSWYWIAAITPCLGARNRLLQCKIAMTVWSVKHNTCNFGGLKKSLLPN